MNFTTKTASLRTVTADISKLKTKGLNADNISTNNVTTSTINNGDIDFVEDEIIIKDRIIKFNPEDENLIPANSVTNEAKIYAESAANDAAFVNDIAETLKDYALNEGKNIEIDSNGIIETKIGHTYVVTTNNELVTVKMMKYGVETDFILCTAYPNKQVSFIATSGSAKLSNINCIVTEVRGISIELGGSTGEPEGDYLTFNENSIVTGGRLDYATNIYGLQYGRNITSWNIPLPSVKTASYAFQSTKIKKWETSLPECVSMNYFLAGSSVEVWNADIPKATNVSSMFNRCNSLQTVKGNFESVENAYEFFWICPNLTMFDGTLPKLSDGRDFANNSRFDKASALRILNSIPTYTSGSHTLMIGIHVDHKTDEEVLAAIESAKTRGWTLQVNWTGTATTATYSLRPAPPLPIYAKPHDDASKGLDWCNELYTPDGKTPEELGYTLFESLEEALENWGLTEYIEIPNEEQINN